MFDDMQSYKAYLIASRMAEHFLLAHGCRDSASYDSARGHEQFENLASLLGYRSEKIQSNSEAAA